MCLSQQQRRGSRLSVHRCIIGIENLNMGLRLVIHGVADHCGEVNVGFKKDAGCCGDDDLVS